MPLSDRRWSEKLKQLALAERAVFECCSRMGGCKLSLSRKHFLLLCRLRAAPVSGVLARSVSGMLDLALLWVDFVVLKKLVQL